MNPSRQYLRHKPAAQHPLSPRERDMSSHSNRPPFFTEKQIAEMTAVSARTVRRWISEGELVAHRFGGAVRIADSDLRTFLALHREALD
jgi:excisionase family DNA binding protein